MKLLRDYCFKTKNEEMFIYHLHLYVMIVSLTTQDINRDQYSNKLIIKIEDLRIAKTIDCIDYYMS